MATTNTATAATATATRIKLVCQECGKTWRVSPTAADPHCPKCNGGDFEVAA